MVLAQRFANEHTERGVELGRQLSKEQTFVASVLIVDADEVLRRALLSDLEQRGHIVAATGSADDALEHLSSRPFDLVIADLSLGSRTGLDLLRAVRRYFPQTAGILLSAAPSSREYEATERLGGSVLTKPFSKRELQAAVARALATRSGIRSSLHGLSLLDVLQMFHLARKSIALRLVGRHQGCVLIESGEIIHAEAGVLRGEIALRTLLAQADGTLATEALPEQAPCSIERPFDAVLLDALRQNDESGPPCIPTVRPTLPSWDEESDPAESTRSSLLPTSQSHLPVQPPPAAKLPADPSFAAAERWVSAAGEVADVQTVAALAFHLVTREFCRYGAGPELPDPEELLETIAHLEAVASERCGFAEFSSSTRHLAVIWNHDLGVALVLAPGSQASQRPTAFRTAIMAAARAALSE